MIKGTLFFKDLHRFLIFVGGLAIIAIGSVHMINASSIGVQPFDVLYIGLHLNTSISIGTACILTGILLLTFSYLLTKQRLKMGTIVDAIFLGIFVDLFLYLDIIHSPHTFIGKMAFFGIGVIFIAFGAALMITSNLGTGPIDTFMLALHNRFNLSIKMSATIIEVLALIIGFFLGGPLGIGTFLYCVLIGTFIDFFLKAMRSASMSAIIQVTEEKKIS